MPHRRAEQADSPEQPTVTLTLGPDQFEIRRRYETLSILNDFLVAAWFLVGSVLFMALPAIRLAHPMHLRRLPASYWDR